MCVTAKFKRVFECVTSWARVYCRKYARASCATTVIFPIRTLAVMHQTPGSSPLGITELLRGEPEAVRPRLWGEVDRQGAIAACDGHPLVEVRERLDEHSGERRCDLRCVRERVGEGERRVGRVVDGGGSTLKRMMNGCTGRASQQSAR